MSRCTATVFLSILAALVIASLSSERAWAAPTSDDLGVWAQVRQQLPPDVLVLHPSWLPQRFSQDPLVQWAGDEGGLAGPTYLVGYASPAGDVIHFALGSVNSAEPVTVSAITVRGHGGRFVTTAGWPEFEIYWTEGERNGQPLTYHIQATGVTRHEMEQIAAGLTPVIPSPAIATLPRSGGLPFGPELLAGVGCLLLGAWVRCRALPWRKG